MVAFAPAACYQSIVCWLLWAYFQWWVADQVKYAMNIWVHGQKQPDNSWIKWHRWANAPKSHGLQPSSDISGHRTRCKMMKVCCHSVLHEVHRQLIMLHFFCCKMLQISTPTSLSDTEMARKFFDLEFLQLVTLGFPAGEACRVHEVGNLLGSTKVHEPSSFRLAWSSRSIST